MKTQYSLPGTFCGMALLLLLVACKKDPGGQNNSGGGNNNPPTNDSIYISEYVELDPTQPSGQDTTSIYSFTYDNSKRIRQISQVKSFGGIPLPYHIETYFVYNGADTLPYQTIEVDNEGVSYVDTSYYNYTNKLVSRDSSLVYRVSDNEKLYATVVSLSANGNMVNSKRVDQSFDPASLDENSGTISLVVQNGNITSQQDPDNILDEDIDIKYDDKLNPFYRVSVHYPLYYEHLYNSFTPEKNNRTEETFYTDISSPDSHLQYSYTYRSDGYPLTVIKTDLLDVSKNRKGVFLYTK